MGGDGDVSEWGGIASSVPIEIALPDCLSGPHKTTVDDPNTKSYSQNCNQNGFNAQNQFLFFNVGSQNENGISEYSPTLARRCSQAPSNPFQPTYGSSTSSSITINFVVPNLHGALHLSTTILMDNGAGGAFQAYVLNDISQVRGYAMKNEW